MLHLARDEFDDCIKALEKGIKVNQQNIPLNNDMRRVIDEVKSKLSANGSAIAASATSTDGNKPKGPHDARLAAYRQGSDEKD